MNERAARAGAIAPVHLAHEPNFVLGGIQVRPAKREIVGESWHETIDPRVMRVLVALARAKGEILTRDDLIESCWDGVIVGEDAINRCISRLRKAAEASDNAFSIETVPRVGFRLIAAEAVTADPEANESLASEAKSARAAVPPPEQSSLRNRTQWSYAIVAVLVCVFLVTGSGLWWFWPRPATSPVEPAASVAVLPFVNMSGDPAKEYFSDGFSEELLNDLSNNPRLHVAARTSAFAFKGKNEDIKTIALALRVRALVEGSVREAGDRVRVTAQLIDGIEGYHIWSATYDRNVADMLTVQDEVARAIAAALTHRLLPRTPPVLRRKIDPQAYRLYLLARQQLDDHWRGSYRKALALFEQVTAKQPDFADAFAGLSRAALNFADFDAAHANSDVAIANVASQRALFLDPRNIEAREVRTGLELLAWNWTAATSDIHALLSESPNSFRVLAVLRIYYNEMGFPLEALATMTRARSLDPLSVLPKLISLGDLLYAEQYQDAIEAAHAVLAREPGHPGALFTLCAAYARIGSTSHAHEAEKLLGHMNSTGALQPEVWACDFEIAVGTGNVEGARDILNGWKDEFPDKFVHARDIANAYVELHDFDNASDWYQRAYERRESRFFESVYWPLGARYRATARWIILTQQPQFREWQAEHDRIAAELAARGGVHE